LISFQWLIVEWTNAGENLRLAVDCSEFEKNLKRAEADSMGIVGSVKKAKKKKGTLVNHWKKKDSRVCVEKNVRSNKG
jgi:hypothetical protein